MPGALTLNCPADLLEKLRADMKRLRESPWHPYCAFDFFVTGFHIVDWLFPGLPGSNGARGREALIAQSPWLQIAGCIANGAKHFSIESEKWARQEWAEVANYAKPYLLFRQSGERAVAIYDIPPAIRFTDRTAKALGAEAVSTEHAAEQLLEFWESYFTAHDLHRKQQRRELEAE